MRIVIVGAGITGVATGEWLRRDGHAVTLIDRIAPGDPDQTSYGNAGILAAAAVVPVAVPGILPKAARMVFDRQSPLFLRWGYLPRLVPWLIPFLRNSRVDKVHRIAAALVPLVSDSVDQHLALARGTAAERFIELGPYVMLYRDRAGFEADRFGWDLRRAHGLEWDELDRAALVARDPALAPRFTFGAALRNHGWVTSPSGYVAALAEHFTGKGGELVTAEVADIVAAGDGAAVELTDGRRIQGDRVVLSAGVWSGRFARRLGHRPQLEAERGYHVMLDNPSHKPPSPYMVTDAKTAVTPMAEGLRFGGVAEFAGIEAEAAKPPADLVRAQIRQVYPDLEWSGEDAWMGRRPSTVDSLPLVGPSPKAPGVIFAFGGQHLGLTMGPKLARLVADLVAGRRPNIDLAPYRVDRFDRG